MKKYPCNKCDRVFDSAQARGVHERWNHDPARRKKMLAGIIKGVKIRQINYKAKKARSNGAEVEIQPRRVTRRVVKELPMLMAVNHCPQCGCNIRAVALALGVAGGVE